MAQLKALLAKTGGYQRGDSPSGSTTEAPTNAAENIAFRQVEPTDPASNQPQGHVPHSNAKNSISDSLNAKSPHG
jgi:hypothetical protein